MGQEKNGQITKPAFKAQLLREEVQAFFRVHDIDVSDAQSFFDILDVDRTGYVEIDEFVIGCARFKGAATSIEMRNMLRENRRMARNHAHFANTVLMQLTSLADDIKTMTNMHEQFFGLTA